MSENFNFLYSYLEKENTTIDKVEFEYQVHSHPEYPSLLSISDTLNFFSINNIATLVSYTEIEVLPNHFVALLSEEKNPPKLYFIEKKEDNYLIIQDKKPIKISKSDLELRWKEIVLLIENTEIEQQKRNLNLSWLFPSVFLFLFLISIFSFETNLQNKLFFLFPIFGVLFSIVALKDLFGVKSELINNFCNVFSSTSCTSVINSDKWKIFEFISFSDLSIIFFITQFFGLLLSLMIGNINAFINIQEIILFASIPIIFISIYFQKFVEKKWCPICLVIIGIIFIEFI